MLPQNISPFFMPPPEYNTTMPQGLSAQLARSQATARSQTKSSTPNSSRRGSTRIQKAGVTENTPHHVQRRRTTAAHSTRDQTARNSAFSREQRLWACNQARLSMPEMRPFSWHPGSDRTLSSYEVISSGNSPVGNTISDFENLAVTTSSPSVEQSIHDAFSVGYGYPISIPTASTVLPRTLQADYPMPQQSLAYRGDYTSQMIQSQACSLFEQNAFQAQPVSNFDSTYTNAYGGEGVRLTGEPLALQEMKESATAVLEDGEELVGIGLYDDCEQKRPSFSRVDEHRMAPRLGPKDLKLEESWQVPVSLEDEDAESSDGAEEVDELPGVAQSTQEVDPAFYTPHNDLSNQSFFLNDADDGYGSGDPYFNYLALNSGLGTLDQWKGQIARTGNSMCF